MNNIETKRAEVNVAWVFAFATLPVLANALTKALEIQQTTSFSGYFSYGEFLYSYPHALPVGAILLQFAIPIVLGAVVGLFPVRNARTVAASAAGLGTFMVVWPIAWLWDTTGIVHTAMGGKRYAFMSIFALHVLAASYLAVLGVRVLTTYQNWMRSRDSEDQFSIFSEIFDWESSVKPAVIAVGSSIGTVVMTLVFAD